jgi:class 3 adenylate cyclase
MVKPRARSSGRFTKSLDTPDEELTFPRGSAHTVRLGDLVIGRLVQEPGWHWAEHIKPIAGTESCEFHHTGVGIAGRTHVRMDDGTEFAISAGDVFDIPPGHDVWVDGDEAAVSIIWGGWRGFGKPPVGDRVLTTMLFTDIAGSTELAARMGDAAWDKLLERHNGRVREVLEAHRGNEVGTTGDGFLATFDGAARAILAAMDIQGAVRELGLETRAAVHSGEVELVPGNLRGLAVHEAARILALAEAGEVLVSSTTRELASGAGLDFIDRGTHRLKGVPDERQVFAVATQPDQRV